MIEGVTSFQIWTPFMVAAIPLGGGAIVYHIQKAADRKNQILQERRELYRKFVSLVKTSIFNGRLVKSSAVVENNDLQVEDYVGAVVGDFREYESLLAQLMVTGPDSVVTALLNMDLAFIKHLGNLDRTNTTEKSEDSSPTQKDQEVLFLEAFDEVVFQMRLDSFEKTSITRRIIGSLLRKSTLPIRPTSK